MAVARGTRRVAADEPKVWFTSTESFAKVLSAGNRELLRVIAEMLVDDKLAACVQEMTIRSRYRWKNEIRCEPELLLLVKTTGDRAEAAVTAIRKIHPYDLPEIIVLPVVGGLADYMNWINVETRELETGAHPCRSRTPKAPAN